MTGDAPRFEHDDMRAALFREVDLSGARFREVNLSGARTAEEFSRTIESSKNPQVRRMIDIYRGPRPVGQILKGMVNEQWWHHQFAVRDLAVLGDNGHG